MSGGRRSEIAQSEAPLSVARSPKLVLALRPEEAADSIGVSVGTFLSLVEEGKMPRPIAIPGHRLVRYDAQAVHAAWLAMRDAADASDGNQWG